MDFKKYNFFFFIFIVYIFTLNISEIRIVLRIDNNIITTIDVENEINFLKIQNPKIKKLNKNDLEELSKNSLIRQIIKKSETDKYFKIENNLSLGEKLIEQNYLNKGFLNESEFKIFLKNQNLQYEIYKEKLIIEKLWNTLIYEKFKNKVKVDEKKIRKRIEEYRSKENITYEYNLSEILYDSDTDYKILQNFIAEYGFETAASKYSISETSLNSGKIGWVKINNLTNEIKNIINNLNKGEISKPFKISNGNLIIKVNDIKKSKNKFNLNQEVKKQINFEQNRQLNNLSLNFYKKLKQNRIIYEY